MFRMSGALHLSEDDTWNTTPRVLVWQYEGLMEAQEIQTQTIWESARFQGLIAANVGGAKLKDPKKLIQFPWEKDTVSLSELSKGDIERLRNKFKKKLDGIK